MKRLIGVVGSGDDDKELNAIAAEVGRLIAMAGCVLVNGGLGGVMRASAQGAREAGGTTLALLPGSCASDANPFIDIAVPTGMGEMRNALIVRTASAVIAIGGGFGTLSEVALSLKTGVPVVGVNTWDISSEIIKADSAAHAVRLALELSIPSAPLDPHN
jgi:uncharacterized protein (TIGR00725 family)